MVFKQCFRRVGDTVSDPVHTGHGKLAGGVRFPVCRGRSGQAFRTGHSRRSGKFCKNGLSGRRRRRQNADSGKLRKPATNRRRLPGFSEEFIRKKRCLHGSSARNYHLRHHVLYRGERCRTQSENRGRSDPENPGDRRRFDETYPAPQPARRILCDGLHQRLPRKRQSRDHLVADRRRHSDSRDRRHQFGQFRDRTDTDPRTKPERS